MKQKTCLNCSKELVASVSVNHERSGRCVECYRDMLRPSPWTCKVEGCGLVIKAGQMHINLSDPLALVHCRCGVAYKRSMSWEHECVNQPPVNREPIHFKPPEQTENDALMDRFFPVDVTGQRPITSVGMAALIECMLQHEQQIVALKRRISEIESDDYARNVK